MTAVFEKLLEMSATAAVVIVVVALIRLLLRKAPKKYSYALWAAVAFRLMCPVSFKSVFSIFRFANVIEQTEIRQTIDHAILGLPQDIGVSQGVSQPPVMSPPVTVTVAPAVGAAPPPINMEALPGPQAAIDWASAAWEIAAVIWLVCLAALLIYGVVSYVRLYRRMANAVRLEENVYQSDRVRSPFILGFIRPKIYLPFGLGREQKSYVLAHERYHLRRQDHIVRPVAFLILAVHWFNPLVWLAYYLMGRDMEMSCDEKVLGGADNIRKAYSITLLSFAANRRFPSPSPLAFGETGVKSRIKNALNWKKPRLWVTVVAVILCLAVLVACAADPAEKKEKEGFEGQSGWFHSVECLHMSPLSSWIPMDGNSGYYYRVEGDTLTLVHNGALPTLGDARGFSYPHDAKSGWEELTEERWRELFDDSLMFTDLWDTIKEYENRKIRFYEDSYFLLDLDGELLVGKGSSHPDGSGYIWDLYRLEPMTQEPQILKEWKAIFAADLNHDGNDEVIEVVHDTKDRNYRLTAAEIMGGNELWDVEVSAGADGNDCYYLYEKDGKTYLMRWSPNEIQSMHHYSYEVFWFDENGDKQVLAEHALQYDIFGNADILKVDLDELRAFEAEVNGLLADATVLFADRGEQIGDPDNPATSVWRSPVEEWERVQSKQAVAEVLAEWEVDLTHDGQPEWARVVATGQDRYEVRVESEDGNYTYWTGNAGTMHVEENGIYLYKRDGKDYLMTWLPYSSTGRFSLNYFVFSLDNDGGQHMLVENGLMYDVMGDNILKLDVADIRAFEDEVNALLADAFVLVDTAGGDVLYSTQDNLISNPFSGYADDAEFQQAEAFGDSPQVHWFVDYEAKNGLVGEIIDYVTNELKAEGITSGGAAVYLLKHIPTGTAGNTFSCDIYRVQYMLSEYDRQAGMAQEQEVQQVYFMTCSGFNHTGDFWEPMGVLTEEELQQYDTAAFETEYGGDDLWLYRAAVMETYHNWKNS